MKHKYSTLFRDTGLFAISNFGSKILSFLLTPLYTSILYTYEYGIADIISTTVNFIYPILTLAIADATLRYALDKECDKKRVLSTSLLFTFGATILLIVIYPIISNTYNELKSYWMIFLTIFTLFNIQNCFANFVKGIGDTKVFAIQGLLSTISIILCNVLFLVVFKMGLMGYLMGITMGYAVPIIYMFFSSKIYRYLRDFRIDIDLTKDMLSYSIPMIPTIIAWSINSSIDKYMIIGLTSEGISNSGLYSVAHKIPSMFTTVFSIFSQAWQISAISNHQESDNDEFYSKVYAVLDCVCLLSCLMILLTCKWIASFLFAKDFFVAWKFVPMLLISALFSNHSGFLAAAYRADKKTKRLFLSVCVGAIVNVILNYVLINRIGVIGAAIATAVSFFAVWLVRIILVQKIVRVKINTIKTVICYTLLIISAVFTMIDFEFSWVITGASIVCVIIINFRLIKDNIVLLYNIALKKKTR